MPKFAKSELVALNWKLLLFSARQIVDVVKQLPLHTSQRKRDNAEFCATVAQQLVHLTWIVFVWNRFQFYHVIPRLVAHPQNFVRVPAQKIDYMSHDVTWTMPPQSGASSLVSLYTINFIFAPFCDNFKKNTMNTPENTLENTEEDTPDTEDAPDTDDAEDARYTEEHEEDNNEEDYGEMESLLVYNFDSTFSPIAVPANAVFEDVYENLIQELGMTTEDHMNWQYYAHFVLYLLILGQMHFFLPVFAVFLWWQSESDEKVYYSIAKNFVKETEATPHPLIIFTKGSKANVQKEFQRAGIPLNRIVILATNGEKVNKGQMVEWWLCHYYKNWVFRHNHHFGYKIYDFKRMLLVDSSSEACEATCRYLDLEILPAQSISGAPPGMFHEPSVFKVLTKVVRRQRI